MEYTSWINIKKLMRKTFLVRSCVHLFIVINVFWIHFVVDVLRIVVVYIYIYIVELPCWFRTPRDWDSDCFFFLNITLCTYDAYRFAKHAYSNPTSSSVRIMTRVLETHYSNFRCFWYTVSNRYLCFSSVVDG